MQRCRILAPFRLKMGTNSQKLEIFPISIILIPDTAVAEEHQMSQHQVSCCQAEG